MRIANDLTKNRFMSFLMLRMCASQICNSIYKTTKIRTVRSFCQTQAKNIWQKHLKSLIKTIYMLLWASPTANFCHLHQNLTLNYLHFSSHCYITIWWWVNAIIVGALFQCLATPCVVCVYHLTLALYCAI